MKVNITRIVFAITVCVLAIFFLIGRGEATFIMPYLFTCLGIAQIFNGIYSYKQNKKRDGIIFAVLGVLIFALVFNIVFVK